MTTLATKLRALSRITARYVEEAKIPADTLEHPDNESETA